MSTTVVKLSSHGKKRLAFLKENEARRNALLKHLNNHGPTTSRDLATATKMTASEVKTSLCTMKTRSEVATTGTQHRTLYIALTTQTESAEALYASVQAGYDVREQKRESKKGSKPSASIADEPWRYIHKEGTKPIPNQGGQGAVRPRVHVNCYQNH